MQVSGKGALLGLAADFLLGTFPLGTGAGAIAKNLYNVDAGDMNRAYDPKRATQGQRTADFGDLKGMANGLLGQLQSSLDGAQGPRAGAQAQSSTQRPPPADDAEARAQARPRTDADATQAAQTKSGVGGWGKALLWGGAALAGLSLLNNIPFFGYTGMPFYGAGYGMMPGMMGQPFGLFW